MDIKLNISLNLLKLFSSQIYTKTRDDITIASSVTGSDGLLVTIWTNRSRTISLVPHVLFSPLYASSDLYFDPLYPLNPRKDR